MSKAIDKIDENVFKLKSADFEHNATLPNKQVLNAYGCTGGNISPQLSWEHAPLKTKSFAIICHDPDAPKENGWYHWLVLNIPKEIHSINEGGKIENTTETITDFETTGYGGACPPVGHGIHHYNFTVYALDVDKLEVDKNLKPTEVEKLIKEHQLAKSTLTATFERK